MKHYKYTKEILEPIAQSSRSYTEVCRKAGLKISGSSITHMGNRLRKFGIDISHFTGQRWSKGIAPANKKSWQEHLIKYEDGRRRGAKNLRKWLKESGTEYKCVFCSNPGIWMGKELILEVDHIDEDFTNCRKENLQFSCSNCHTQKTSETKRVKKKRYSN